MDVKEHMKRVAYNFKRLRNLRGWTQAKTAEKGEVDTSYIGQVETAQGTFSVEAQRKWTKIFDVDICEFYLPPDTTYIGGGAAAERRGGYEWATGSDLSEAEVYLVDLFRHLNEQSQEKLLSALEELGDRDTEKRKDTIQKIREILKITG